MVRTTGTTGRRGGLRLTRVAIPLVLSAVSACHEPATPTGGGDAGAQGARWPAELPAWVEPTGIGMHIVGNKRLIELDEATAEAIFVDASGPVAPDWRAMIEAPVQPADDAQPIPEKVREMGSQEPPDRPAQPIVLRFSADAVELMLARQRMSYLWHEYYQCLARFRAPRTPKLDAALGLGALTRQYATVHAGVAHGMTMQAAIDRLGQPDASRFYQPVGYRTHYFFDQDLVIDAWQRRVKRIEPGVPEHIRNPDPENPPARVQYR